MLSVSVIFKAAIYIAVALSLIALKRQNIFCFEILFLYTCLCRRLAKRMGRLMPGRAYIVSIMLLGVFATLIVAGFFGNSSVFGCTCYCDLTPPKIHRVWHYPEMPEYEDKVLILAYITDSKSGVANATLSYSINMHERINLTMNKTYNLYTAEIPLQPYNSTVTYMVYAYDKAGNLAVSTEHFYVVGDFHPPTITRVEQFPLSPNYNESVLVVVNATEPPFASGVKELTLSYSDEAAWTNITMNFNGSLYTATIPRFPQGTTVSYIIYAADNAENLVALDIYSYTVVDRYLPVAIINAPVAGSYLSDYVKIEVFVSDDNFKEAKLSADGTLLYTWNTAGPHAYLWNTGTVVDGFCILKLEAYDNAGNIARCMVSVTVDNTSPEAEIQWPLNATYVRGLVLVKLHAEDANFEKMELKIGEYTKVWRDADQTYAWNTVEYGDGLYTLILTAYDKAGNKIKHEISVVVDNTPPIVGSLTWAPKEPVANEVVNVSVQVSESGSGIKNATLWFRRLGDEWTSKPMSLQGGNWTCTIPGQEENAVITFYAEFYDNAGNVAKILEEYYIVKASPGPGFPLYWLLLIIIVIFGAILSTAYYFRLRKRRGAGPVKYLAVSG